MLAQEFLTLFVLSNFYKFCDVRIQKAGFRRVGVVERGMKNESWKGITEVCEGFGAFLVDFGGLQGVPLPFYVLKEA